MMKHSETLSMAIEFCRVLNEVVGSRVALVGVGVMRYAHHLAQILRAQATQSAQSGSFE